MRRLAFIAIATLSASAVARAQTYDPAYPVCMHIYGPVGYFDCRYKTLDQCRFQAVGRPAQCIENPYFPRKKPGHRPARSK